MLFRKNNEKPTEPAANEAQAIKLLSDPLVQALNEACQRLLKALDEEINKQFEENDKSKNVDITRDKIFKVTAAIEKYMLHFLKNEKQPELSSALIQFIDTTISKLAATTIVNIDFDEINKHLVGQVNQLKEIIKAQTANRERTINLEAMQDFYKASHQTSCVML